MEQTYIVNISDSEEKEVTICGWVANKRSSGKIEFIQVRDGTGVIQSIASKADLSEDAFAQCKTVTLESSVCVKGKVHPESRAPGGYELHLTDFQVLQLAQEYPIQKNKGDLSVDYLFSHRHLWLRSPIPQATLKVRAEVIRACRQFFDERDFLHVDGPLLSAISVEGTTNLFEIEYNEGKLYLSQSAQLYMEAAAMASGKVYSFGPAFRAEKAKTRRHLLEFWMIEPEIAFATLDDIVQLIEEFITYLVHRVLKNCSRELETLERDIRPLEMIAPPFARITYAEALEILKEHGMDVEGKGLGGDEETFLSHHFGKPVFIDRFPTRSKAFYVKPDPQKPEVSLSVDLIASEGYGEIIGGGQREDDLVSLEKRMEEEELPKELYEWYLDLRRYGSVPHSGFGMGIERVVAWICGAKHVRETIPFPRMLYRLYP